MFEEEKLCIDDSFGILTRPALEIAMRQYLQVFDCLFIDFNNMGKLNKIIGYGTVNKIIQKIFNAFIDDQRLVGRWFSGDEIIVVCDNVDKAKNELTSICHSFGMTFKHRIFRGVDMDTLKRRIDDIRGRSLLCSLGDTP
jgi:GGDEF domain-containing protein